MFEFGQPERSHYERISSCSDCGGFYVNALAPAFSYRNVGGQFDNSFRLLEKEIAERFCKWGQLIARCMLLTLGGGHRSER